MATVGWRSQHPLSTASFVVLTLFAIAASPAVIEAPLHAITGRRAQRIATWLCRLARKAAVVLYLLCLLLAAVAFLGGAGQGAAVVFFLGFVVGSFEGFAWMLRSLIRDLAWGGAIDRRIAALVGPGARETLVGFLFIVGSCLGLAATLT